jgi:hypothetical protein
MQSGKHMIVNRRVRAARRKDRTLVAPGLSIDRAVLLGDIASDAHGVDAGLCRAGLQGAVRLCLSARLLELARPDQNPPDHEAKQDRAQ